MTTLVGRGRAVGGLVLLQLGVGLILPFVLILPLNVGSPGYLLPGVDEATRVRASVLAGFLGAALCVAIAAAAFPVVRRRSESLAVALVAVCTISAVLDAVHNSTVMAMLAMAKYAAALPLGETAHLAAASSVYSARITAHYSQLFGFGAWLMMFYAIMFRCRLIPRPLALLGVVAVALQFTGVTLSHYLGYPMQGRMAMPLAPVHAAAAIWLIVRGFSSVADEPADVRGV